MEVPSAPVNAVANGPPTPTPVHVDSARYPRRRSMRP